MSVMSVGGHTAAIDLGMIFGGKYYGCQTTFNHEFVQYSVGRLLALRILEEAFAEGMREVDMLVGNERYKYQYRPQSRNLYSVVLFQDSLPGHIAEGWFRRLRPRLVQSVSDRKQPLPLASLTRWMHLRTD